MKSLFCKLLLLILLYYSQASPLSGQLKTPEEHPNNPTNVCDSYLWAIPVDNNTQCKCGSDLQGIVRCNSEALNISLLTSYCMTHSDIYNKTLVSYCYLNCFFLTEEYAPVPNKKPANFRCDHFVSNFIRRTGQNCGNCQPGYAPAVFSFELACVECEEYKYNWLKYTAMAFLPLTVAFVIILLFRINVTSGAMNTYILASQLIAAPVQLRYLAVNDFKSIDKIAFDIGYSVYSIWNLDILNSFYTPFCIHPSMTTLQLLALQYAMAIYPMLLIPITSILVHLHGKYSLVVRLWRPFYWIFARIRREWNVHSFLIDAFATLLLLSYVKIANISFDLLTPVSLYDVNGTAVPKMYLYYAGTVEYFGREHLPYAILALVMFLLFNIFPLLLFCLYPCRCFHKCLNHCQIHSNAVHAFVYIFQGCYKTKPYDCRYFAGIYLGFRLLNLTVFAFTTSPFYYALAGICSLFMTVLIALVKPYNKQVYVSVDVIFFAFLTLVSTVLSSFAFARYVDPSHLPVQWYHYAYPALLFPPLYGTGLLVYKFLPKNVIQKFKTFANYCKNKCHNKELEDPPPYRLEHSDEYPPLLDVPEQ